MKVMLVILMSFLALNAWKVVNSGSSILEIKDGSNNLLVAEEVYVNDTNKTVHIPYHDIDSGVVFERERNIILTNVRDSTISPTSIPTPPNIARCGGVGAATALRWDKDSESWICVDLAIPNLTFFYLDGQAHTLQDCEEAGGDFFAFNPNNGSSTDPTNIDGHGRYCMMLYTNDDGTTYTAESTNAFDHTLECENNAFVDNWAPYKSLLLLQAKGYTKIEKCELKAINDNICRDDNTNLIVDDSHADDDNVTCEDEQIDFTCEIGDTTREYTSGYIKEDEDSFYVGNNTSRSEGIFDMSDSNNNLKIEAGTFLSSCTKNSLGKTCVRNMNDSPIYSHIEGYSCH